jgi:hypothetical protein
MTKSVARFHSFVFPAIDLLAFRLWSASGGRRGATGALKAYGSVAEARRSIGAWPRSKITSAHTRRWTSAPQARWEDVKPKPEEAVE